MKKAIKRVMGMSILLVGLMTYAENGDPKPVMEVMSVNGEKFVLILNEVKSETSLIIKDQYGFVFYMDQLEARDKIKKTYNISSLPEGSYVIQVLDDEFSKTYTMSKTNNDIVVKIDFSSQGMDDSILAVLMN